jgi:L-lactate dehydrogenase complex protein LldG
MIAARHEILSRIRKSLGRGDLSDTRKQALDNRLRQAPRNLIPRRAQCPHPERIDLFVKMATAVSATVTRVKKEEAIPEAVAVFMEEHQLPAQAVLAPEAAIAELAWESAGIQTRIGRAEEQDLVSVTPAYVGIAETGSLVVLSGPAHPSTLNLLPDNHIAVLKATRIVGTYEDAWDLIRKDFGQDCLPRTVLLITGPSRSADIGLVLQMGAHGPRRLHIILVEDADKLF